MFEAKYKNNWLTDQYGNKGMDERVNKWTG